MKRSSDAALASGIEFRPLDAESFLKDVEAFLAIAADVPGEYWTRENFLTPLPEKWPLSFAAYDSATPIAYAVLSRKSPARAHLHHLMVAPSHRGRGLGARMVGEMAARAREAGAAALTLKSTAPRAEAFYRRHGFFRIGTDNGIALLARRLDRPAGRPPVVAIHQPNYLPWLGYFHKIAQADAFVFLETAQYSKGSYTNRVQILRGGKPAWLSQPIRQGLGQPIEAVGFASADWPRRHLDALRAAYAKALAFDETFAALAALYETMPLDSLAAANRHLIEGLAARLGLAAQFVRDGELGVAGPGGDERLVALVNAIAPGATYLSGKGGRNYQDPAKFEAAGIALRYTAFAPAPYPQAGGGAFVPGLSIVDALFALGFAATRTLIAPPE
ncbi:MAG: WbqC family protein [Alphaproteobacteria bacterium]